MRCRNSPADSELRVPGTPDSTGLESRPPAWLHDKQHKIPRSSAEKWRQLRPPASRVRQDREQASRPALRIQRMRNVDCMKYRRLRSSQALDGSSPGLRREESGLLGRHRGEYVTCGLIVAAPVIAGSELTVWQAISIHTILCGYFFAAASPLPSSALAEEYPAFRGRSGKYLAENRWVLSRTCSCCPRPQSRVRDSSCAPYVAHPWQGQSSTRRCHDRR